jgi:hypothetical protein
MRIVTLGPEGSCHENATMNFLSHHNILDYQIIFVNDLLDGIEQIRNGNADYVIQCSAHVNVHLVTEKYHNEIVVTDTFIYPTKEIALLENADVASPDTIGLVKACEGYLGDIKYPNIVSEITKPIVGENMLKRKYDAGITYLHYHLDNPGFFRVKKYVGKVITTWLVYGKKTYYSGKIAGVAPSSFYRN